MTRATVETARCRKCGEPAPAGELYCDDCVTSAVKALVEITGVECAREDGLDQLHREYPHRPFAVALPGGYS